MTLTPSPLATNLANGVMNSVNAAWGRVAGDGGYKKLGAGGSLASETIEGTIVCLRQFRAVPAPRRKLPRSTPTASPLLPRLHTGDRRLRGDPKEK
jgi:hypothetical protein